MIEGAPYMLTIPAVVLLEAWEQGREASPGERGLLLLGVAHPDLPVASLAEWTVGQRDAALLALRERVFGSRLAALAECPRCNEPLDIEFPRSAITLSAPVAPGDPFVLECAGHRVVYRLPTAGDLAALGRTGGQTPARWLLERCVLQVDGARKTEIEERQLDLPSPPGPGLPEAVLEALGTAMAEAVVAADPHAEIDLALTCPACGVQWQAPFDIVSFLWQELDAWAARLLAEVHILASNYGWSEPDILALSPWRRQRYLDLIGL